MEELIARRQLVPRYIWLDIAFILVFAALLVQFGWDAGLLAGGIRSAGFSFSEKLSPQK